MAVPASLIAWAAAWASAAFWSAREGGGIGGANDCGSGGVGGTGIPSFF